MHHHSLAALALLAAPAMAQEPTPRQDLAVLYAGVPDHPRTKVWLEFLGQHFKTAKAADLAAFEPALAEGFDVVIVDAPSPFTAGKGASGFQMPKVARIPADFAKPMILLGAAGGAVLNQHQRKLDWL